MVNLSYLHTFTKGNPKKIQRYIQLYLTEAEKTFELMAADLAQEDWESLKVHAHSLKPQAELIGVSDLKEVLMELEENLQHGESDTAEDLLAQALSLHESAVGILEAELE